MANLNEEIKNDCKKIIELIDKGHVVVKNEENEIERIVNLGNYFGLLVFGGAIINDNEKVLYID